MLNTYGVESPFQLEEVRKKIKLTNIEKYGFEYAMQNSEIQEKTKQTKLEKYGLPYYLNIDKKNKTNLERYNTIYPQLNEEIIEKTKQTNLERHGVEYPMQNAEIFNKGQKNAYRIKLHENFGIFYQGTYEKHFLDFCFNNNILVEKHESIKYILNNINHIYHPDFYLKNFNLIVEIKSDYYYKKHLESNLAKQSSCLEQNYNFIFIINKDYSEFKKIIGL